MFLHLGINRQLLLQALNKCLRDSTFRTTPTISIPISNSPKPNGDERQASSWSSPNIEALRAIRRFGFENKGFSRSLVAFAFSPPPGFGNNPFGTNNPQISIVPFGF